MACVVSREEEEEERTTLARGVEKDSRVGSSQVALALALASALGVGKWVLAWALAWRWRGVAGAQIVKIGKIQPPERPDAQHRADKVKA
jgi:hypothetical protein